MMSPRHLFLTLLLAGVFAAHAQAQPADQPAPKPDPARRSSLMADDMGDVLRAEEPKIKERMDRIDAELKALDRSVLKDTDWAKEWAGTYYEGDGLGTNVSIHLAPKAGIAFLNYGCTGLYGGDHGEVLEALPDGLRLKLAFGDARNSFLSERVYFVKWGDQRFLVPEWLMPQLVNNYNRGGYARSEMYDIPRLTREGERRHMFEAPNGRPELPPQFAKLLLSEPLDLKVTKVSKPATRHVTGDVNRFACTIEFEGGSDKGAYVGMEFRYPKEISLTSGRIRLTAVTPITCAGEFVAFFGGDEKVKTPALGETISTADAPVAGEAQPGPTTPPEPKAPK